MRARDLQIEVGLTAEGMRPPSVRQALVARLARWPMFDVVVDVAVPSSDRQATAGFDVSPGVGADARRAIAAPGGVGLETLLGAPPVHAAVASSRATRTANRPITKARAPAHDQLDLDTLGGCALVRPCPQRTDSQPSRRPTGRAGESALSHQRLGHTLARGIVLADTCGASTAQNPDMVRRTYELVADVSTADPAAIEPVLRQLVRGEITGTTEGFHMVALLHGATARDLNPRCLPRSAASNDAPVCARRGRLVASRSASSTACRRARAPGRSRHGTSPRP